MWKSKRLELNWVSMQTIPDSESNEEAIGEQRSEEAPFPAPVTVPGTWQGLNKCLMSEWRNECLSRWVKIQLAKSVMIIATQYFIHLVKSYKHRMGKIKRNFTKLSLTAFGIIPHESICVKTPCFSASAYLALACFRFSFRLCKPGSWP